MMQFITKKPVYHMGFYYTDWAPGLNRFFEPLDPYLEKYGPKDVEALYGKTQLDIFTYEGKLRAFPVRQGCYVLYYRKDLFEEKGLTYPQAINDYVAYARKLTEDKDGDGLPEIFGTKLSLDIPLFTLIEWTTFLMPRGWWLLTEDLTKPSEAWKTELAKEVAEAWIQLKKNGSIPDPLSWSFTNNIEGWQSGRVAMAMQGGQFCPTIVDPKVSKVIGKLGFDLVPHKPLGPNPMRTWSFIWSIGIDKNASEEEKRASFEFIKFLGSPEIQKYLAVHESNGPTVLSVYNDPEYMAINPAADAIKRSFEFGTAGSAPVKEFEELATVAKEETDKMMTDRQSVNETLDNIYNRMMKIMTGK
jgi:multiple sugar transport system substrate-binding protein